MGRLSLAVMAQSRKEHERRLPIHPQHIERIDADLRRRMFLERGYGEQFGVPDARLEPLVAGLLPRRQLVAECDVVLLPKPVARDLAELREGQVLWGWPHCVQNEDITQLAIDRRLTLIAFEAMNHWSDGEFSLHVFHKNNEMAGYCSVLHALQLTGTTGDYGQRLRAAVVGFGATGRGAVTALNAHGIHDVDVVTHRGATAVAAPIPSTRIVHFEPDPDRPGRNNVVTERGPVPMAASLARHDIVVNCVLQHTDRPLMLVTTDDLAAFTPGSLVVDVSCDAAMGFAWARPTTFTDPMFTVGDNIRYYAVDHSPSYLWNSATWEISEALLPYLRPVLDGPAAWDMNETVRRAIEIRAGVIQNPRILSFQDRSPLYPHHRRVDAIPVRDAEGGRRPDRTSATIGSRSNGLRAG